MNGLVIFEKEGFGKVRTTQDKDGGILFAAIDVCSCLDITDAHRTMESLDEDEKGYAEISTSKGGRRLWVVTQSGLFHLIFLSRKQESRAFRRWITDEVIPSIIKTGKYELKKPHQVLPLFSRLYLQKYSSNNKKGKAANQIAERIGFIAEKLCTGKPVYLYDVYAAAVDCGVEKISCDMGSMLAGLVLEGMRNNGYRVVKLRGDRYIFEEWEDESNEL